MENFEVYDLSGRSKKPLPSGQLDDFLLPMSIKSDDQLMDDVLKVKTDPLVRNPFSSSTSTCDKSCLSCLDTCNYIKGAKLAKDVPLIQYMYLVVCAKGCKRLLNCINDNYCLPVMQENPDYFIICVNNCPLFPVIPKVFLK
ncbi:uncharacterized protein LOC128964074 [Oppia nitens]|uniref:uncharacterized protein LOC128964074 n=1 Tax=Oppia nitens TaxID=1686743 RepID=UPI0023DB5B70|nr:uncharacterized protein LOC128964074 [Oppia nitens]